MTHNLIHASFNVVLYSFATTFSFSKMYLYVWKLHTIIYSRIYVNIL